MRINRMMLLAGMALTAIAFAAPAIAQADVRLTDPKGTTLAKNSLVTATSTDFKTETAAGTFTCKLVTLHYKVASNGPNQVLLKPVVISPETHNGTFEECHLITAADGVTHTEHIKPAGTGDLAINTWGTATTNATFTSLLTLSPTVSLHCEFHGNVHFQGSGPETDVVNVGPSTLTGTGAGCLPGRTISGTVTLETSSNGTPVTLDFVKTG